MQAAQCASAAPGAPDEFHWHINKLLSYNNFQTSNLMMAASHRPNPPSPFALKGLARAVQILALLGAFGLAQYAVHLAWAPELMIQYVLREVMPELPYRTPDGWTFALLWGALSLPLVSGLLALWHVWRLFGHYAAGRVFDLASVRHLQWLGWGLLALAAARPLSHTLAVLTLSWHNPPGQRQLLVGINSDHYALLMLGLVLVAMARIMRESVRVAQENAEFV